MGFKPVSPKVDFAEMEEKILQQWKERDVFHKTLETRKGKPRFVFYEGPPTANGKPGIHHVLARAFKDLFNRFKVMEGYYVLRKAGWDTHGLPVEIEVEKELGFSGKKAIEEYGVEKFNQKCKESVFRYVKEWERLTERIAFWIDMEHPYVTYHNSYIESVWWILKQFWEKGLLYQDYKVVPYCPRCGTPLSSHELALGYREGTKDPSIFVKFPVKGEKDTYFLVWTTTPWTLPGNVALAVDPDLDYVEVEQNGEKYILAEARLKESIREEYGEYKVLRKFKGEELVGKHYEPLYRFLPVDKDYAYVVPADFVTTDEGTGVVHMAPAFGADDMEVCRKFDLPILMTVGLDGKFIEEVTPWKGMFVKDADPLIIEELEKRGLMYWHGIYVHTYPFCWRCGTPLLYYAKTTWYIKTTAKKDKLLENNEKINWVPEHIKHGRFGNWLENNIDWAVGRDRYWGTPLPIWKCDKCGHTEVIGSVAELSEKAGRDLSDLDLHRPYVDEITWKCEKCGGTMRRVPEVADAWLDSGSMPVAQWHYPFENQELFKEQFPADFISEAVDQTRGWFYTLHAVSTLLFDEPSYRNVICLGLILAEDGRKMSKHIGNIVDPWDVIPKTGVDAIRWYLYTASPPGNSRRFSLHLVEEVVRSFLLTLWNTYSFFVTYANLDGFDPTEPQVPPEERSELDRWLLAETHALIRDVTEAMERYDVTDSTKAISRFVESLSNWYIRRSRRRFWRGRGEDDKDKMAAYQTLYEALVTLSHLLAPFTPFVAEEMYQNLVLSFRPDAPESVHLSYWPSYDEKLIDEQLRADMALAQQLASLGHAARQRAGIKVRQPLAVMWVHLPKASQRESLERMKPLLVDELNVKDVKVMDAAAQYADVKIHLLPAQLGRKYGALYPKMRAAVAKMDQEALAAKLQNGEPIQLEVEGQTITVQPDEAEVRVKPRSGYAVAMEGGYMVALSTEITRELRLEGYARELVRHIQELRKDAGFDLSDRIVTYLKGSQVLADVLSAFGDYVARETLSQRLVTDADSLPEGLPSGRLRLGKEEVEFAVEKVK